MTGFFYLNRVTLHCVEMFNLSKFRMHICTGHRIGNRERSKGNDCLIILLKIELVYEYCWMQPSVFTLSFQYLSNLE